MVSELVDVEPACRGRERNLKRQPVFQSGRELDSHKRIDANVGKWLPFIYTFLRQPQNVSNFFDDDADDLLARFIWRDCCGESADIDLGAAFRSCRLVRAGESAECWRLQKRQMGAGH